jgi:hypothetical protein
MFIPIIHDSLTLGGFMQAGQKLTIFSLNMMAMTSRDEVTFEGEQSGGKLIVSERPKPRQRKIRRWVVEPENDTLVFDGWDLPITSDMAAGGSFRGNACLNMVGDIAVIRDYVKNRNLNPLFSRFDSVLCVKANDLNTPEVCVFSEVATSHAVVQTIRETGSMPRNLPVTL